MTLALLRRVEVRDGGSGFEPIPVPAAPPPDVSGWGLFIVDRLATRWGTDPGGVVWAEVDHRAGRVRMAG